MSVESISEALRFAATEAKPIVDATFDGSKARWAFIPQPIINAVSKVLGEDADVSKLRGKMVKHLGGAFLANPELFSVYLIDRAFDVSADEIAADLIRFAREPQCTVRRVQTIAGVVIDNDFEIGEGLRVVQPASLHDSLAPLIFHPTNVPNSYSVPPTAALVRDDLIPCELERASSSMMPTGPTEPMQRFDEIVQRARRALILASKSPVELRQYYTEVLDAGWPFMAMNGPGMSVPFPARIYASRTVNPNLAKKAFTDLGTHPKSDQLHLAIAKLENSRGRSSHEERVIDLGTCLEILLMHGSDDNNEIRFKIGVHSAWLLSVNGAERLSIYKLARKLYDERSKAVHTGKLSPPTGLPHEIEDYFGRYDDLCARLITRILDLGAWPDWPSVILNVDPAASGTAA